MIRKIIQIDENKCNGCGACISACHEGAIANVNGKAKLIRDDYCDGLGDCLPTCPTGAITFVERDALPYDDIAVKEAQAKKETVFANHSSDSSEIYQNSYLSHWPVQLKLVPIKAAYFDEADLLIAADCTAFTYGDFHRKFIKNRTVIIGCPKLDAVNYAEKLAAILYENNIKSITVVRMEVPCCGGLENATKLALDASGKNIPLNVVVISTEGVIKK